MDFSETLSYGVLLGTSLYCRFQTNIHPDPLDLIAFAANGITAVLSLYHARFPEDDIPRTILPYMQYLQSLSYPCLVGYLWLRYGEERYIAYAHPFAMVLLRILGTDLLDLDRDLTMTLGYTLNKVSCLYLSNLKQNMYAMAGTAAFFLTETCVLFKDNVPLPPTELMNYGLSVVVVLFSLAYKEVGKIV